jgi:NAD(P)-dependent dehydrogenase (short-subunit alcohol dehydrogenase family)
LEIAMSDSQFNASSTADEVLEGVDLTGRRALVTGAGSGIGAETARALAAAGAEVTMAVRNVEGASALAASLSASRSPDIAARGGSLRVAALDLADLGSVRALAAQWSGPLDMLVNNAGVMALPELTRTGSGWELQFATNHLGHFALASGLRGALAAADGARVVSVASIGHLYSPVVFDDLHYDFRPYDPWTSYGQSKSANVLFAVGVSRLWADDGIVANALMPGNVGDTALARHIPAEALAAIVTSGAIPLPPLKTVAQGAATSVLLAASPSVADIRGRYFEDCAQAEVVPAREQRTSGVAPYALDEDNADRLWAVSSAMVGSTR